MGMIKRGIALMFKQRDFGLLMAVQFAAQAGDGIVQTALAKFIAFGGQKGFDVEGARSPEELLRIALYIFVPYSIISPFLGVVIDRWDRRRLLFLANGLRGAVMLVVGLVGIGAMPEVGLFLAFMLTLASTRVVLATKAAAMPATVDEKSLVEGNAVSQLGGALFQLGGAGLAFIATQFISVRPIVLVGAAVYIVGGAIALAIKRAGEPRARSRFVTELMNVIQNIWRGLREVARVPKAAASISTYFWLRLLWSFSIAGIGLIARELVAGDDLQILILTGGAGAVGAGLGFLTAGVFRDKARSTGHIVLSSSTLAGVAVAVLGGIEVKISIAVLTFFLGFGFFLGKISLDTMVQEALGDDFRGRAFSLYDIAYNVAWVLAAAILNIFWSPDLQGLLIAAMGVVFLIGVGLLAAWFRAAGLLAPRTTAAEARP
ncbi:MAG: MFS transporter [Actinomycetota bacterium]